MEGSGVVAVVQGLRDAGLAVTLLARRFVEPAGNVPQGTNSPIQVPKPAVDIGTETAAPVLPRDVDYRSNYQLNYCRASTSSPVRLPQYSSQGFHQFRSSISRTPDEEAFVESLRKYPNTSPNRSQSAELIERMILYTQNKNGAKYSNSRSAKSLPVKEPYKYNYGQLDEIPTRDSGISTDNTTKSNFGYKRDVELIPAPSSSKKPKHENDIGMYDYLKSGRKDKKLKGSEVRYLTNVKQCLKERLKQMCEESPTVCPNMLSRYNLHQKQHHQNSHKCAHCRETTTHVSAPTEEQSSPCSSRKSSVKIDKPFKQHKACFCNQPVPCDCPPQPSRPILKSKVTDISEVNRHRQCMGVRPTCPEICMNNQDVNKNNVKEAVMAWAREIPVYANFSAEDSLKREEAIDQLIEALGDLPNDEQYIERAEEEIRKCLEVLPMWHPESKHDHEIFNNKLVDNLFQRLKSPKSGFDQEISKWVEDIPFIRNGDKQKLVNDLQKNLNSIAMRRPSNEEQYKQTLKSEVIRELNELSGGAEDLTPGVVDDLADNLVEKLIKLPVDENLPSSQNNVENVVMDWVKDIPKFSSKINLDEDGSLINDLISKLNNLQNEDIDRRREQISYEITNWLNTVEEKKKCQIDQQTKNLLTNQLIKKILDLDRHDVNVQNFDDVVSKWLQDNTDALGIDMSDHKNDVDALISKLKSLESIENKEHRQNSMRKEILDWLQDLDRKQGKHMDIRTQENLVNKLIDMIKDNSKQKTIELEKEKDIITQKISEWLENQKALAQDGVINKKYMVTELSKKLQNLIDEKGQITESDVRVEVTKWLDKMSDEFDINIDADNIKTLENLLLSCIKPSRRRKSWAKPENVIETVTKEVTNVLDDLVKPLKKTDKESIKDQIVKVLTRDSNALNSTQIGKTLSEVIKIFREKTTMPDREIDKIAHDLIDRVKAATKTCKDTVQKGPIILDKQTKDKLRSKLANVLQNKLVRNKSEVINKITDILAKEHLDVNEDVNKTILDTLKNTEISGTDVENVTKEILNITNQLRNEIMESGVDSTYKSLSLDSIESLKTQKKIFMQRLEREITDFMEKVLDESSSFFRDGDITSSEFKVPSKAQENPPFKTSTPKSGSAQIIQSVEEEETRHSILSAKQLSNESKQTTDEKEYKLKIKGIIRKWINSLELNGAIGEKFKDDMANDLANDIIDREMYMQMSKLKSSSKEDMEHLKYQIFKWTNKLPNPPDLTKKTSKIMALMKSLEVAQVDNLQQRSNQGPISESETKLSLKENIVPTQDTSEFIEENIYGVVSNWLEEVSILKPRNSQDRRVKDNVVRELAQGLKEILTLDADKQIVNMEDRCKAEILKYLKKMNVQNSPEDEIQNTATELMNHLKAIPSIANILENNEKIVSENVKKKNAIRQAVHNWCQKLPLQRGTVYEDIRGTVDRLADAITKYLLITDMDNVDILMSDILNNLKQLPIQFDKEGNKKLPEFTEKLIDTLKGVLNDSYRFSVSTEDTLPKPAYKKAAELMYGNIQDWCDNLPLKFSSTQEDIEKANMIKQNVEAKLLKKIGELNLDPEIFHDDILYEDVLKDEIEQILDELPKTPEIQEVLPTLKENLIKNVMEAKEAMKTEMEGYAYKQQLRDAISKTLSSVGLPVINDSTFEVLKDKLADAFISLHYVADDKELKNKFKEKIFDEVTKFCNDYLKRYPSSPLNANQLNQDLYEALKKVPIPKDESLRREAEHIRMKDFVSDWFKDLPLKESLSPDQETKIISILAKKLHEIEKEAELNPNSDTDDTIKNEISKWLKKFNLNLKEIDNETAAEGLVSKLKATKDLRKLDKTAPRKSFNYADLTSDLEDSINVRPRCPPTCLNVQDRAHLQRIRERASTVIRPDDRKEASVSPAPVPACMQTEERQTNNYIFQKISQNASIQTIHRDTEPAQIVPQVIIKEYYWDSTRSPPIESNGSLLSGTRSPVIQAEGRQEVTISQRNAHTAASQTLPLPSVKATITQEASIGLGTKAQTDHVEAATQSSCVKRRQNQDVLSPPAITIEFPGEAVKRDTSKPCRPCHGRPQLPTNVEVGSNKILDHQELLKCGLDCRSRLYEDEYRENETPCFRRRIYQTPEYDNCSKRKKDKCGCRNHTVRCTIRPKPCPQSHKSCSALINQCPKCWEGFCPHPSYLYFKRD